MTEQLIALSAIVETNETQGRIKTDLDTAKEYSRRLEEGVIFPPIDVFHVGNQYILADGAHRVLAARLAGFEEILCEVHEGSLRDAILYSCGVNAAHGLPRTIEDKTRAVKCIITDTEWGRWANTQIAKMCNVSEHFVRSCRVKPVLRPGRSTDSPRPKNPKDVQENGTKSPKKTQRTYSRKGVEKIMDVTHIGKKKPGPTGSHFFTLERGILFRPENRVDQLIEGQYPAGLASGV